MGRRLFRWTGHAQGSAPSSDLCSRQRGNVDELASTHNELKYKQKIFYFSPSRLLTVQKPPAKREPLPIQ